MDKLGECLEKLIPSCLKKISYHMDFEGQKKAELFFQVIIVLFSVVGFVWGYVCQQFSQTFYIVVAGFVTSCLLTLPPWPIYRKHPLNWQPGSTISEIEADHELKPFNTKAKKKKKNN